jgi:nicotinamide mononucleotide transporter
MLSTLICVWLNVRQNIWGWFWAVISSGIYAWVYFTEQLYSDMELQFVFIAISVYGYWHWRKGSSTTQNLAVTNTPTNYWIPLATLALVFTLGSGYLHSQYTNAYLPYADSALTAISLIAQWLMARKYIENWWLWIVANIAYIVLYYQKNLLATAVLYFILLLLAGLGYKQWKTRK